MRKFKYDETKDNQEFLPNQYTIFKQLSNEKYEQKSNDLELDDRQNNRSVYDDNEDATSNYNFKIDKNIIEYMHQKFMYPPEYIIGWLDANEANYCTATYYLLWANQNY